MPAYGITDPLYPAVYHATSSVFLYPVLMNLRLKRAKTIEAHSFHIYQTLASHNGLDVFAKYLTKEQQLWLCRNIRYLQRNAGFNSTFNELVENLLTKRGIPLVNYSVRAKGSYDDNFYPDVFVKRKPINPQVNTEGVDALSLDQMFEKERKVHAGNENFYSDRSGHVSDRFKNSESSITSTKLLDSTLVDYSDMTPDPFSQVLMRQWLSMCAQGLYSGAATFKDPRTNLTNTLYVEDALRYYLYILYSSCGFDVVEFPKYLVIKALKVTPPTKQEILDKIDYAQELSCLDDLLSWHSELRVVTSTASFFTKTQAQYEVCQEEWNLISNEHELYLRGATAGAISMFYEDVWVDLAPQGYSDYKTWLGAKNLQEYDYTHEQAQGLLDSIFTSAVGYVFDESTSLKKIHEALIGILLEFSSYTLKCVREINDSNIIPVAGPFLRIGRIQGSGVAQTYAQLGVHVVDTQASAKSTTEAQMVDVRITDTPVSASASTQHYDTDSLETQSSTQMKTTVLAAAPHASMRYAGMNYATCLKYGFYGADLIESMSEEQRARLVDVYSNR